MIICNKCGYNENENPSPREQQVLDLYYSGMTTNQVANDLCLAARTVSTYWHRARLKLGVLTVMGAYLEQSKNNEI